MSESKIATYPAPARTSERGVVRAFRTIKIILAVYSIIGLALVFIDTLQAVSGHGDAVSSMMWGRAGGVFVSGAVLAWFVNAARNGKRWAYRRVRAITVVVPIVIIGLMLIPGAAPLWFRIVQFVAAACLAVVAVVINKRDVRRAFA